MKTVIARILILSAAVAAVALFFALDLRSHLTIPYLKQQQSAFEQFYQAHAAVTLLVYFLAYVVMAALSLPGAAVMTLAGGALFGLGPGLVVVSFASTIGATVRARVALIEKGAEGPPVVHQDVALFLDPLAGLGAAVLQREHPGPVGVGVGENRRRVLPVGPDVVQAAVRRVLTVNRLGGTVLDPFAEAGPFGIVFEDHVNPDGVVVAGPGSRVPLGQGPLDLPAPSDVRKLMHRKTRGMHDARRRGACLWE